MIDMEEGVVNEILKGPLRDVFDCQQLITDVSGSGNNWLVYCWIIEIKYLKYFEYLKPELHVERLQAGTGMKEWMNEYLWGFSGPIKQSTVRNLTG